MKATHDWMIDHVETKSQPMTKVMVLKAYGKLRANKGGAGVDGMTWGGVGCQPAEISLQTLEPSEFGKLFSCACSSGRDTEEKRRSTTVRHTNPSGSYCPTSSARSFGKAIGSNISWKLST